MDHLSSLGPLGNSVFLIIHRQVIPLNQEVTRIGRQLDNDIVLHEEYVSRLHAEIRLEQGKYVLYDQQSTGGTFVNSKQVDRCVLNSGDLISVANIQIMFVNNNPRFAGKSTLTTRNLHASELPAEPGTDGYGTRAEDPHH
jgi:pSer/pThr/pTyr-binding forkhead associated (FHA) protein